MPSLPTSKAIIGDDHSLQHCSTASAVVAFCFEMRHHYKVQIIGAFSIRRTIQKNPLQANSIASNTGNKGVPGVLETLLLFHFFSQSPAYLIGTLIYPFLFLHYHNLFGFQKLVLPDYNTAHELPRRTALQDERTSAVYSSLYLLFSCL